MADTTKEAAAKGGSTKVWTDAEKAAMKESARERKVSSRRSPEEDRAEGERDVRAKLAEMPSPDREMGERIHELVLGSVPELAPKTYYGMPAYALNGKTICFFKPASKFKVRYATFEFQPDARLDDGDMWPVSFAVNELTPGIEQRIAELVKRAVR
jgi:uncharacterized protein YdhG (YjbR/CyaY superfamily)